MTEITTFTFVVFALFAQREVIYSPCCQCQLNLLTGITLTIGASTSSRLKQLYLLELLMGEYMIRSWRTKVLVSKYICQQQQV